MKRVLVSLLIVGGAVYATHTLLLPYLNKLFTEEDARLDDASSSAVAPASQEEQPTDRLTPPADATSRHAIVVESNRPTIEPLPSEPSTIELAKVTTRTSIQEGPSSATAIVGILHPGAEAQIISRLSEWVQIIDPASKKSGWIHSQFLEPQDATGSTSQQIEAALDPADESAVTPSTRPETSARSKRSGKAQWKRKRHKRGVALRFRLRRLF
jgi:uncharacterized protein YgiM (DUF1202 family)